MSLSPVMPIFQCHKRVRAAEIASVDGTKLLLTGCTPIRVDDVFIERHGPKPGDWLIEYEDGYRSVSPAKAFFEGYSAIEDQDAAEDRWGGDADPVQPGERPDPDKPAGTGKVQSSGLSFEGMK